MHGEIPGPSFKRGDVLDIICLNPKDLSSQFPFLMQPDSIEDMISSPLRSISSLWCATTFFLYLEKAKVSSTTHVFYHVGEYRLNVLDTRRQIRTTFYFTLRVITIYCFTSQVWITEYERLCFASVYINGLQIEYPATKQFYTMEAKST